MTILTSTSLIRRTNYIFSTTCSIYSSSIWRRRYPSHSVKLLALCRSLFLQSKWPRRQLNSNQVTRASSLRPSSRSPSRVLIPLRLIRALNHNMAPPKSSKINWRRLQRRRRMPRSRQPKNKAISSCHKCSTWRVVQPSCQPRASVNPHQT